MADPHTQLETLITSLADICIRKKITIATAESCTGGGVAFKLTTIPGSSRWFERGFVTYSNLSKIELLKVPKELIERHGAVSEEVACRMAEGAIEQSAANISLAITGIAGPEGGSLEKPVGTCWFAWSGDAFITCSAQQVFAGDRTMIRSQAITFSLKKLLQLINANY